MKTVPVLRGADSIAHLWYRLNNRVKFVGGYIRWMVSPNLNPAPPGDIDIYPNDEEDTDWVIQEIAKLGLEPRRKGAKTVYWHTTTLANTGTLLTGQKIQVINPTNAGHVVAKGTMADLLNNFDFTVTRAGLLSLSEAMVDDEFIEDELAQKLVIKEIHCPIGAVKRIAKYSKKGYYCPPGEIYKLFIDWEQRSEDYKTELKEVLAAFENVRHLGDSEMDMEAFGDTGQEAKDKLARLLYVD